MRGDKPIPRDPGEKTPCYKCDRCEGVERKPNPGTDLTARNWQAYWHYLECRAVGQFPNDAIVRRNAALIRMVEDSVARQELREMLWRTRLG